MTDIKSRVKLNNGVEIPIVGLGVYLVDGGDIESTVRSAIVDNGYRHIDTASYYKNEKEIGDTLKSLFKEGVVKREELFITTKVGALEQGYQQALDAFDRSIKSLQLDYLDCYLIHWPGFFGENPQNLTASQLRSATWKALEKLYAEKKIRSIGVSNYSVAHLQELLSQTSIVPVMNQVEYHPYLDQLELLEFCNANNIKLEAYGSLGGGKVLSEPVVNEIAKSINKTPSQVLLRWAIQKGIVIIPKSTKADRIKENAQLFDFNISDENMTKLNSLNKDKRFYWDPNTIV